MAELNAKKMVCYISFDFDILKKIREIDQRAFLQYLQGDRSPEQLKEARINGADYHFSVFEAHPDWVERARLNKILVNAWTVNNKKKIEGLLRQKIDFITTNEPEMLFEILGKQ